MFDSVVIITKGTFTVFIISKSNDKNLESEKLNEIGRLKLQQKKRQQQHRSK